MRKHIRCLLNRWPGFVIQEGVYVGVLLLIIYWPAQAHDAKAWTDPARDKWFRALTVPGRSTSCCNFSDASAMDPEKVRQRGAQWFVDVGHGWVPVPPERVIQTPISIDGLPYIFMMTVPTEDSPNGIRCFVPPVGTY